MMNLATKADLERFATKEDLALLRVELHRELNLQTWRLIGWSAGTMTALTAIFAAIVKLT